MRQKSVKVVHEALFKWKKLGKKCTNLHMWKITGLIHILYIFNDIYRKAKGQIQLILITGVLVFSWYSEKA